MKNMQGRRVIAGILMLTLVTPANAFVVTDPGLTMKVVMAEAARLGQTATMINNQINQYSNMIANTISLRDTAFAPLGNMLRSLHSVYMQSQSLMFRAQNLDREFGYMYPSYSTLYGMGLGGPTMISKYREWSDQGNQNVRTAMQAAGIQVRAMESDDEMLQRLMLRSATAGGQKSALQAGNEIAALNVQQLQRLQSLVATNLEMQANFIAQQNQRQSVNDAWTEQYRKAPVNNRVAKDY